MQIYGKYFFDISLVIPQKHLMTHASIPLGTDAFPHVSKSALHSYHGCVGCIVNYVYFDATLLKIDQVLHVVPESDLHQGREQLVTFT